ncbi:hypothetical protein TWF730_004525 [Orbilia blumenaviensis]|uniref:Rhodanese domain-containing protein n=1 Tax=Orbilia blumenaviensis TaxID=1796055 RepID=A0AAV9TYZ5_9PEZI
MKISLGLSRRIICHPTSFAALHHLYPHPFLSGSIRSRRNFSSQEPNINPFKYTGISRDSNNPPVPDRPDPPRPKMEVFSIADLKRIGRDELAEQLLKGADEAAQGSNSAAKKEKIAIVDVRDSDFIGGHLVGCLHRPSSTFATKLDDLIEELKDHDKVVFHCALSQQRGPSAALKYIREKKALEARKRVASSEEDELLYKNVGKKVDQEVLVLEGGFVEWQQKYGGDKRLTESWRKEIWEEY